MTQRVSRGDKELIAYLYQAVNLSIDTIADMMRYSKRTICNYKNYQYYRSSLTKSILGKRHRRKRQYLSTDDRKAIAFICQRISGSSRITDLADTFNISTRSIYRYKGYQHQPTKKPSESEKPITVKTEKFVNYWESKQENMIKKLVDNCRKILGTKVNQSDKDIIRNIVRRKFYDQMAKERKTKFSDLPEYKSKDPEDIIIDLTDIVFDILQS